MAKKLFVTFRHHLWLSLCLLSCFSLLFSLPELSAEQKQLSGWESFAELTRGNLRFVQGLPSQYASDYNNRSPLLDKKGVHAVVVTCSDSRVVPEILFDQGLGNIFVVRTAGFAQDEVTVASVEYAIVELGARLLVFLVSESCQAITARKHIAEESVELKKLKKILEQQSFDTTTLKERLRGTDVKRGPLHYLLRNITRQYVERSDVLRKYAIPKKLLVAEAIFSLQSGKVDFVKVGRPELRDNALTFHRGAPSGFSSGGNESVNPAR